MHTTILMKLIFLNDIRLESSRLSFLEFICWHCLLSVSARWNFIPKKRGSKKHWRHLLVLCL